MNKEEVKTVVTTALREAGREELPAFKRAMKLRAFFEMLLGSITKETADAVCEAIDEYGVAK